MNSSITSADTSGSSHPTRQSLGYVHPEVTGQDNRRRRIRFCLPLLFLAVVLHVFGGVVGTIVGTGMTMDLGYDTFLWIARSLLIGSVVGYLMICPLMLVMLLAMRHRTIAVLVGFLCLVPVMNVLLAMYYAEIARDHLEQKGRIPGTPSGDIPVTGLHALLSAVPPPLTDGPATVSRSEHSQTMADSTIAIPQANPPALVLPYANTRSLDDLIIHRVATHQRWLYGLSLLSLFFLGWLAMRVLILDLHTSESLFGDPWVVKLCIAQLGTGLLIAIFVFALHRSFRQLETAIAWCLFSLIPVVGIIVGMSLSRMAGERLIKAGYQGRLFGVIRRDPTSVGA